MKIILFLDKIAFIFITWLDIHYDQIMGIPNNENQLLGQLPNFKGVFFPFPNLEHQ